LRAIASAVNRGASGALGSPPYAPRTRQSYESLRNVPARLWRLVLRRGRIANLPPSFCLVASSDQAWAISRPVAPADSVPFVSVYRTLCLAPTAEFRRVLEEISDVALVA